MQLDLKNPIVFFDIESTGLNIAKDRIIEISAVKVFPERDENGQNKIEVKTFANITQAKEWVSKFCGIDKSKLRRPAQTIEAAAEHGIKIEITKE